MFVLGWLVLIGAFIDTLAGRAQSEAIVLALLGIAALLTAIYGELRNSWL